MTDEQIIKGMECCMDLYGVRNCNECPLFNKINCIGVLHYYALDLVNRQRAEFEKKIKNAEDASRYFGERMSIAQMNEQHAKNVAIMELANRMCKDKAGNDPIVIAFVSEFYDELTGGKYCRCTKCGKFYFDDTRNLPKRCPACGAGMDKKIHYFFLYK